MADEKEDDGHGYDWLAPQAIFCDFFALDKIQGDIIRFSFAEYVGNDHPPIYRVGIAMPVSDAKVMLSVLQRALEKELPEPGGDESASAAS